MTIHQRGRAGTPAAPPSPQICDTDQGILIDNILSAEGLSVNGTMFQPGEHTFWHSHGNGQLFIVNAGRGVVVTRDGSTHFMEAGDVVYTPPGEEHWHGASPDCFVQYTAASMGQTSFAEPVVPGEYSSIWD